MTVETSTQIPDRLYAIIVPHLKVADISAVTPDADLRSLGLDSMQAIELLFAIEDEFGCSIDDSLMNDETFRTPANLWGAMCVSDGAAT